MLSSPLYIEKNKKGDKWYLNLNNYRNTHYQTSNKIKHKYKDFVTEAILPLPTFNRVSVTFCIYARDKSLFDIGNIRSVHEKFFCDALVELGKLPEDNYLHIPETHTYFMGLDRENPRVDIIIKELPNEHV